MRILHMIGSLNSGGSQTMVLNLLEGFESNEINFDFVIDRKNELFFEDRVKKCNGKIYVLPLFKGYNLINYCYSWYAFLNQHKEYKIIHGHVRSTGILYLSIAKLLGRKTIIHSHNTNSGNGIKALIKNIMQFPLRYVADYYFACSNKAGEWLFGSEILRSDKYHIIKNAINSDKYKFHPIRRKQIRDELKLSGKFVIGHVGRFHKQKNHKFIIEVFSEFIKFNSESVLVLIGDGELMDENKKYAAQLGIDSKVFFLGVKKNVNDILSAFDCFLFPSLWEGLPVTLVEAQASGLHCFVSDNITDEVCITKGLHKLSLELPASIWAREILEQIKETRVKVNREIVDAGFDVSSNAIWLRKFYENIGYELED